MAGLGVEETFTGIQDDCEVIVTYKSARFIIQLKRPDAPDTHTIEGQLLHDLDVATDDEDDDLAFDRCLENINEIAVSTCETTILNIAASQPVNTEPLSLEQHLYPTTFLLQLITVDGHLEVLQHDDAKMSRYKTPPLWIFSAPFLDLGLPIVQASDVQVIECIHFDKVVKVYWNKKPLIFKTALYGGEKELFREIKMLHAISEASSSYPCLQVPQIRAIIVLGEKTFGFLADYLDECQPLSRINIPATSIQARARWSNQIQKTIKAIHALKLVWGDVKTENILIDGYQQAWLVDFAGSFTKGWIDDRLKETLEGDMQGLERVIAFLDVNSESI